MENRIARGIATVLVVFALATAAGEAAAAGAGRGRGGAGKGKGNCVQTGESVRKRLRDGSCVNTGAAAGAAPASKTGNAYGPGDGTGPSAPKDGTGYGAPANR